MLFLKPRIVSDSFSKHWSLYSVLKSTWSHCQILQRKVPKNRSIQIQSTCDFLSLLWASFFEHVFSSMFAERVIFASFPNIAAPKPICFIRFFPWQIVHLRFCNYKMWPNFWPLSNCRSNNWKTIYFYCNSSNCSLLSWLCVVWNWNCECEVEFAKSNNSRR